MNLPVMQIFFIWFVSQVSRIWRIPMANHCVNHVCSVISSTSFDLSSALSVRALSDTFVRIPGENKCTRTLIRVAFLANSGCKLLSLLYLPGSKLSKITILGFWVVLNYFITGGFHNVVITLCQI